MICNGQFAEFLHHLPHSGQWERFVWAHFAEEDTKMKFPSWTFTERRNGTEDGPTWWLADGADAESQP